MEEERLDATVSFGMKVRYARLQMGMSAEEFGILYGKALGRKPYTRRRIEQMEHNDEFPTDPTRRWVIEKIVQMGLFLPAHALGADLIAAQVAITSPRSKKSMFDISEHATLLKNYWTEGFSKTLEEAKGEVLDRIYALHDTAPYLSAKQKMQAWRILAGYHILLATDIYGGNNDVNGVIKHTNIALHLAKENKYSDIYALALLQRGVFFMDQGNFQAALRDFLTAEKLRAIPPQLRGKILAESGRAIARMAQKQDDLGEAMRRFDLAEGMVEKETLNDFHYFVAFDKSKYLLGRGEALIGSPVKHLRSPEVALSYLPQVYRVGEVDVHQPIQTLGHRQAHNHIIQAAISIDQEMYPIATTLLQEALDFVEHVQSKAHLPKIIPLYEALRRSPYGNSTEVTMLEIGIMRLRYPELFAK